MNIHIYNWDVNAPLWCEWLTKWLLLQMYDYLFSPFGCYISIVKIGSGPSGHLDWAPWTCGAVPGLSIACLSYKRIWRTSTWGDPVRDPTGSAPYFDTTDMSGSGIHNCAIINSCVNPLAGCCDDLLSQRRWSVCCYALLFLGFLSCVIALIVMTSLDLQDYLRAQEFTPTTCTVVKSEWVGLLMKLFTVKQENLD